MVAWFVVLGCRLACCSSSLQARSSRRSRIAASCSGRRDRARRGRRRSTRRDAIKPIEQFYAQIPESRRLHAISGFPTVVDGNAVLRLKPWEQRTKKAQQIADELRPQFAQIPGAIAFPLNPPSLGQSFRSTPVEYVIMSHGAVRRAAAHRRPLPGRRRASTQPAEPADSDLRSTRRNCACDVNRDKLSDVGVPVDTVGRTLETMLGGRQVTRFKREGEQYDVIVQVAPRDRSRPNDISDIYVRARDGRWCSCPTSSTSRRGVAPQSLNHFNRLRAVKITATLAPGYTIGEALECADGDAAKRVLPTDRRRPTSTASRASSASPARRSTSRSCWR